MTSKYNEELYSVYHCVYNIMKVIEVMHFHESVVLLDGTLDNRLARFRETRLNRRLKTFQIYISCFDCKSHAQFFYHTVFTLQNRHQYYHTYIHCTMDLAWAGLRWWYGKSKMTVFINQNEGQC